MRDQIERALCEANGCVWDLDPASESRNQWRRDVVTVTSAILAELETPSADLIATCMEQWCMFPDEPDRDVIGIMQAAAAHLRKA